MPGEQKQYYFPDTWHRLPGIDIQLGNVVLGPKDVVPAAFPTEFSSGDADIKELTFRNYTFEDSRDHSFELGLYTKFMASVTGAGVDTGTAHAKSSGKAWSFEELVVREFEPTKAYVKKRLAKDDIMQFMKKRYLYETKLFMINGMLVAKGASLASLEGATHAPAVDLSADGTPVGYPGSVGVRVGYKSQNNTVQSFESASDFVFAFRLTRIDLKRMDGSTKQWTKGAVLGGDLVFEDLNDEIGFTLSEAHVDKDE